VEVTVRGHGGRKRRAGVLVHRSTTLEERDMTFRTGIPVTTPARTVADLRRVLPRDEVEKAMGRATARGLPIGEVPGFEPDLTLSGLERRVLRACRHRGLPLPEVNTRVDPFKVDFLWREQRLIVEVDSWRYHGDRMAFDRDRSRDVRLTVMGYQVLRFTDRQIEQDLARVVATVRGLLNTR
jgi:very-short-patch-repair endonuclease